MTTQTQQNAIYYASLLILQYLQEPKAYATIQNVVLPILMPGSDQQFVQFNGAPASGHFQLSYNGISTSNIQWNDNAATLQTALNSILVSPLVSTVSGNITDGFTTAFSGYTDAVQNLSISVNTLLDGSSNSILGMVNSIGDQLPLEVQNAFNLLGSNTAVGAQLDILGKYAGVTRSGYGFNGPITLDDTDFLTLIRMAIIRNHGGSTLFDIQRLLNQFFPNQIFVFDYQNMNMSYLIDTSIGSQDLIDLFVTEKLLPKPMGVGLSVVAAPIINKFFAFSTYDAPASVNTTPFQTYDAYDTSWLWLSYNNGVPTP